jgi:hypothetical protein
MRHVGFGRRWSMRETNVRFDWAPLRERLLLGGVLILAVAAGLADTADVLLLALVDVTVFGLLMMVSLAIRWTWALRVLAWPVVSIVCVGFLSMPWAFTFVSYGQPGVLDSASGGSITSDDAAAYFSEVSITGLVLATVLAASLVARSVYSLLTGAPAPVRERVGTLVPETFVSLVGVLTAIVWSSAVERSSGLAPVLSLVIALVAAQLLSDAMAQVVFPSPQSATSRRERIPPQHRTSQPVTDSTSAQIRRTGR